jgi:ABC-type transport system involved in multi-copper enzyme maturation permease subunit
MSYRIFWAMMLLYTLALLFIFFGIPSLVDYFTVSESAEAKLLKNFVYNFPDVWQNLSWVASLRFFIKIFLGLIIIILICSEFSYNTIRSNIINGLSRWDFLKAKLLFIVLFTLVATVLVFISGLILGLIYSSNTSFATITGKLVFLVGYFVEVFTYLTFALFLAMLIKRTGFAIAVLFLYPIIEVILQQRIPEEYSVYLPINAMNQVLKTPNTSLIQYSSPDNDIKLQTAIEACDLAVSLGYAVLFILLTFFLLKKRDL